MRNISKTILLFAGILLTLAGCQKGSETNGSGREVKFKAVSGVPGTRTEFAGAEGVIDGWERINWKDNDKILIWSDNAENRDGREGKSAIYNVINPQVSGKESKAGINRAGEDGLVFLTEESSYQFWGIYPYNAYKTLPTAGEVSFDIFSSQTADDMSNAVMLAYASIPSEQDVNLVFNPAFTAFSFTVAAEVAMSITGFSMTSVERTNGENTFGPSTLCGTVAAKVEGGEWKYTVPAASEPNTVLSTTFSTPIALTKEEGAAKTNEVTFVLFAVPADITSLTLQFNVTVNGNAETRKLTVSYAKDDTNGKFAKGDPVSYAGLRKHNIKGIVLPASVSHDIVLDFQVMPWVDSEGNVTYGPDDIVNAVALEYASGAAIKTGGSRRRQNNFDNATDPIIAYFSVFTPENASWKIKVSGATDKFTVTGPTGSTVSADGTEISGPVNGRVVFKIDRAEGATVTASDQIQLNFYVVTEDGREISINSEITRRNELTISGKVGQ